MKKSVIICLVIAIIVIACIVGGVLVSKNRTKNSAQNNSNAESRLDLAENNTEEENNSENVNGENSNENTSSTNTNGKKILVVYYSAQNHTKNVAEEVAKELGADTFEIEPEEKYSENDLNWTDSNSRVNKEHEDENLRNVKLKNTQVPNWNDYDTVLIGYPIWWGIAAWPTDSFVKANDFTGKTVIPFCTSYSSGVGQSDNLLKNEAKGGDWKDGKRFSSSASTNDIKSWANSLGL